MKIAFYGLAALMIVAALVLLLFPLMRHGRYSSRPRGVFALALGIAFVLPLSAAGLYLGIGTPRALDGVDRQAPAMDVNKALAELRAHLAQAPDDRQGWALLAQTTAAMGQSRQARDAYDHLLQLDPDNSMAMVGWAEADSMARADHRIEGRARTLLERAVQVDPSSQRGLWLLGISDFQQGRFAEAAATWRTLQPLLEPGSNVATAVAAQIAVAEKRVDAPAASTGPGPTITVKVSLAPALRQSVRDGDVLFVYAKAEHGAPMPLAVARLDVDRLPAEVTLTDAMAMAAQANLSSAKRVFVGARISHDGQAIAQAGDLEGDAGVVPVDAHATVSIVIDREHP